MDSSRHASSASTRTTTPVSSSSLSDIVAAAAKQLHHNHRTSEKDSSSSPRIGGTTTKTHQPLLEARKKRIVEISMAEIDRRLDSWLESDDLRGSRKRRRGGGDDAAAAGGVVGAGAIGTPAEKKRAKHQPTKSGLGGRKLACPFAQQNPGKYAGVKTCMGPGWQNVHRVK